MTAAGGRRPAGATGAGRGGGREKGAGGERSQHSLGRGAVERRRLVRGAGVGEARVLHDAGEPREAPQMQPPLMSLAQVCVGAQPILGQPGCRKK